MKSAIFTIRSLTPSLNKLLRTHWRGRMELKKEIAWELLVATDKLDIPIATEPLLRKVSIVSHRVRFMDLDNLYGSTKVLTDCLIDMKLIYDDRPTLLELDVSQKRVKHRAEQRTVITLSWEE